MEFVRFWASCHNFPDLVDLLVIFFLQQEPYKLPPVKELQENTATDLIDGWNCAFKSITWRSQHLQNATITDLVRGFFRFYQNFDFCFYVISPFFGCAVEKSRFLKPYNLPEAFQHYCTQDKELGVGNNMDVQHPFELSKNLCDMDLNAFSVRCHQADLGGGGVKLTYVVEKETGDDYQWIQLVEKLILFILERVCGGTVHQKKGFYEVKGSTNIWKNRIRVAKTMKKPRRDLEREIFITDAVKAFATPEEWSFIMDVKFSTEPTTLQISFDPSTSISTHFIYFHLVKALQHLEDKTSSINSILEKGCINNRQIISLLDQLEMEPKSVEATISYLRLLFESPRKITAAPTVLNSDPLDVHIEFNHPPPLEKIASSLNHSTGFIDVVLNSETITCRFLQNGLTCRVKLTKEDPNNDMMRKCASVKQVRRLMTLVKFWADCHNLTGTGGFSSNAVYFLVVFFLQQGPWNLSLAKDYWKTSHILKNAPIQKLFFAFFQFYGSFDYISNVVSPYFGVVTAKEAFLEQDFDSSLCVLDFFNKSAGSFSYDLSGHFTALCRASLVQGDTLWSPSSNVCCLHVESCINKRHKVIKMAETVFKEVFQCSLTRLGCDKVTFNCTGAHNIWDKRITVAKTAILPQNEVDREATLSSLVIKNFPENSPWTVSIELSFTGHNAKVEFMQNPHLCHFTHIKLLKSIFGKRDDTISGDFEEKLSSFCKTPSEEKLSLLKTDLSSCFKQGYSIFVNGHSGVASEVRVDVEAADLKELKQSLSSKFTAVCEISGTVKCVHFETKVPVVLFLKDELEVCRSLLIQSYLNSDERIEKLSIFVKTWVGSHKLHLPDLALVLMVISFLQKDQKVPAVATLQQETIPYLVDGWNCAFAATKSTLSPEVTLLDLIEGFFKFYREFNCFYYALCPFLGRLITKKRFLAPMSLPKCYSTYVARNSKLSVDSGLCVQDPFNHSLNVAEEVSYEEVCKFSRICDHAIRVMRHCEKNLMESLLPWNRNDSHICKFTVPLEGEGSTQERVKVVNDLFKTMVVQVLGGEAKQRKGGSLNTQYKCKCPDVFTKRVESGMSVLNTLPPETTGLDKEIAITSSMNIEKDYLWCWGTQINVKKDPNMVTIVLQGSNPHVPSHFLYTQFRNFLKGGRPQPPDSHSGLKRANTSPEDSENKRRRIEGKEKQAIAHTEKLPKVNSAVQPPPNLLQSQGKIKLSRILKMINFDRQVSFVLTNYFVDQNVLSTHIKALKVDIKAALAPGLTVELHPYGSAVTKTFTPTSHFDFYVEILKKNPPVEPSQLLIQSEEFDKVSLSKRVLKCRHKTLQVTCSLEFSERIRIQTTRLIAYYLSLDKKLRQLLCLVKKWFRQSSDLENVISIYALCAMVIFYLQQKPYSLPAVNKLQFTEKLINEWNVAFTPVEFKCEALEKVSLKELFFGFFKFYARFDYYLYVIAPFSGEAVKKTSCGLTKVTSLICIQDFFVLDENLTLTVDVKSFEKLTKTLMNAVQIITFLEEEVLYNLLAQCRNGTLVETSGFLVPKETSWDVAQWISSTEKVALLILTKMFGCAITIINKKMISVETLKGGKAKFCKVYQKLESFANEKVPEITIECSAPSTLLWKNRGKILNQKNFAPETSDFDTDIAVSKLMLSKSTDKTTQHLQVVLTFLDKLGVVKIELKFKQDYHLNHFFFIKLLQGLKEEVPPPTAGPSYKILVVGLLEQHQKQIHDYFAGFGEIKSSSVLSVDKTIAVEFVFVEKDVYLEVIQKEHCILDTKIHLVPLGPLNVWKNAKFKDPILKDIHEVTKHKTFDQQAEALWKNRNIHKTTIERREEVVINDLNAALFLLFPHEPVYSGFKTEHHYLGNSLDLFIDIAPKDLVDVKKCISKDPNFDNVEINATTKNICFKGVHVGTRINFRLHLGRNRDLNRLLKHHLSSSAHIEKLVMIVTFWMKCHLDSFSKKMSYLLVVFFLQQQPYNLPPLMVPPISTNYSTALQESTMVELVTGFFKFYADFDYVYYVISPYYGLPVEKTCFLPPYRLPECFLRYQDNTPLVMTSGLCIQDVFDHAHNLSEEVSMNAAGLFSHLCRCSLETISLGETLLLYRLLLCNQECAFKYPEFVIKKPKELDEAEWRQKVKTNTVNILTKVLDYKWSQVSDFDSNKISFACVSQNDIWKHRIQGAKLMELLDFEGAEKEVAITKATKLEKATRNLFIQLIFTEDEVKVVFVKKTKSSDVFHVCHFLYTRLMRFLENTETSKFSEEVPEAPVDEPKHVVPCTDEVVTILDSEDEEEDRTSVDVPSDFFDDFVKEDFLDGLNIAEEWSNQESRKCDCSGRKRSRSSEEGEEKRMSSRVRNKSNSPEEPTRKKLSVEIRGRSRSGCMEDKQSEIDEQKLLLHNL